jgi:hypothetical protein
MQVALRGHHTRLTYDFNYTWAHEFDDTVSVFGAFVNPTSPKNDVAQGDIDVRNNFTADAYYQVPDIQHLPRLLGRGWDLGSIMSVRSGFPVNIVTAIADDYNTPQRPNFALAASMSSIKSTNSSGPNNQFNEAAFVLPSSSSFGDVPRNAGRGPDFAQFDLAFMKHTPITEKWNVEFRTDIFNIVNHPNFANPDGNVFTTNSAGAIINDPGFGRSTSTVGSLIGTGTSRQIQFSLKIIR